MNENEAHHFSRPAAFGGRTGETEGAVGGRFCRCRSLSPLAQRQRGRMQDSRTTGSGVCDDLLIHLRFKHGQKRLLRDFDFSELLHPLLAFFLLLQQLAFAGNVAAVALRGHVLSH